MGILSRTYGKYIRVRYNYKVYTDLKKSTFVRATGKLLVHGGWNAAILISNYLSSYRPIIGNRYRVGDGCTRFYETIAGERNYATLSIGQPSVHNSSYVSRPYGVKNRTFFTISWPLLAAQNR